MLSLTHANYKALNTAFLTILKEKKYIYTQCAFSISQPTFSGKSVTAVLFSKLPTYKGKTLSEVSLPAK